ERQGIDLGAPVADDRGSESVPHFQLFGTDEGTPLAAFEEHADGTVYLAYLAPTGPEWYDVGRADDTEESRNRVIPAGRGRRRFAPDWGTALAAVAGARAQLGVARATPPLPGAGDYCFRDVVSKLDPVLGNSGPPEWQTILPVDSRSAEEDQENGQRRADPDRPLDAPGNHAVSWDELVHLTQTDLARAFRILRWSGHPSREDIKDRPIPWI